MKKLLAGLLLGFLMFCLVGVANAATVFLDDFEDLNPDGWSVTGGGSTGTIFVNGSNMAYASNSQSGSLSLSREFTYESNYVLSFDMQTLANTGSTNDRRTTHAASGITISFENSFNQKLGEVSFVYATSATLLPSNAYIISNTLDSFEASMSDWANIAMVDPVATIADIELEFWSIGRTRDVPLGSSASATIYFDNIQIESVPIPGTFWLIGSGLLGLVGYRRRINK